MGPRVTTKSDETCAPSKQMAFDIGACCPASCGFCGGRDCEQRQGGREACCARDVAKSNRSCARFPPPCKLESEIVTPSACGEWVGTASADRVRTNLAGAHFFWINGVGQKAARRGRLIMRELDAAGVRHTRVPAIYTNELTVMQRAGLNLSAFKLVKNLRVSPVLRDGWRVQQPGLAARTAAVRGMYRGCDIGSTMSHIKAIAIAANSSAQTAVIAEDDVSFATVPRWQHTFTELLAMAPPGWRLLRLQTLYTYNTYVQHDMCRERHAFTRWYKGQTGATAYVVSRDGMQVLLRESGWPDLERLSAFFNRAVSSPINLQAFAGGWGTAGSALPDDLIVRPMFPGAYTYTKPLFINSGEPSGVQTAGDQDKAEVLPSRIVAAYYRCGKPPWLVEPFYRCATVA